MHCLGQLNCTCDTALVSTGLLEEILQHAVKSLAVSPFIVHHVGSDFACCANSYVSDLPSRLVVVDI